MVSCTLCARCNATVRVSLAITPWDWTSTVYSISIHIWKSNLKMCDQGPTWTTPRILSTVCQVWPKSSHVFVGHLTVPLATSRLKEPPRQKKKVPQKNFNGFSPFCLPKKTSPPPPLCAICWQTRRYRFTDPPLSGRNLHSSFWPLL